MSALRRTGGSARDSTTFHWLAPLSREPHSLHNWPGAGEGGGRGPVLRIGRVEEEEEERSAAQLKRPGWLAALWLNTPTALYKSGTTDSQPINLLTG